MHDRVRADVCQSLFRAHQHADFVAFQRYSKDKGKSDSTYNIYNSSFWSSLEHTNLINTSKEADDYLKKHPQIMKALSEPEEEYGFIPKSKSQDDTKEDMARLQAYIDNLYDTDNDEEEGNYNYF